MTQRYQIADLENGGNFIKIDVTAGDDGSLNIFDLSYGETADMFYGEGRDVEHWIDITPEATRQFSVVLFSKWLDDPANEVAKHLAAVYKGDRGALRRIKAFLDEKSVPYEIMLWT